MLSVLCPFASVPRYVVNPISGLSISAPTPHFPPYIFSSEDLRSLLIY